MGPTWTIIAKPAANRIGPTMIAVPLVIGAVYGLPKRGANTPAPYLRLSYREKSTLAGLEQFTVGRCITTIGERNVEAGLGEPFLD
jgi:hypothetical protein